MHLVPSSESTFSGAGQNNPISGILLTIWTPESQQPNCNKMSRFLAKMCDLPTLGPWPAGVMDGIV